MDNSLKRFEKVYPAGGSENSVVELSLEELESLIPEYYSGIGIGINGIKQGLILESY